MFRLRPARRLLRRPSRWTSSVAVTRHDSNAPDLSITPVAAQKLAETAARQQTDSLVLRVAVEGGGCSGFKYVLELEDGAALSETDDVVFEQHGGRVVVDRESLELVRGSTVDFEQELIRSAFVVVDNPNAVSGCGCGTSFDLRD
ncbi:unnamed protein product [Hyaloperonospora brassicae]|uniref:Core domain-containing protein n=1 Tax=Hyaloperonospora brassicae TaxID=162125 RepID=A0AAV0U3N3_HYABA|nr:unnamed protein product [Hyaloperonospora brassicae]